MLRRRAADHTAVMEKAGGSEHRTNVFLVEDSASIRSRLSEMLGAVEGVSIVGEAESPAAAIRAARARGAAVPVEEIELGISAVQRSLGVPAAPRLRCTEIGRAHV